MTDLLGQLFFLISPRVFLDKRNAISTRLYRPHKIHVLYENNEVTLNTVAILGMFGIIPIHTENIGIESMQYE